MDQLRQRTIGKEIRCSGIGLHCGTPVTIILKPASENHGVTFRRLDIADGSEIPAQAEYVVDTSLATTLGNGSVRIGTVEHLCAALCGLGIDNLRVELDGPEIPILDGSAAPFAYLLRTAGIVEQRKSKRFLVIRRPVTVGDDDREASFSPAPQFTVSCNIDFKHPLISDQHYHISLFRLAIFIEKFRERAPSVFYATSKL